MVCESVEKEQKGEEGKGKGKGKGDDAYWVERPEITAPEDVTRSSI